MAAIKYLRRLAAAGDLENGCEAQFQFTDAAHEPTDDPMAAIKAHAERGGKGFARLEYACPRTGNVCGGIIIGHPHKPDIGAPSWQWDGNLNAPTLSPSINCRGGCGWHGFLRAGVFEEC